MDSLEIDEAGNKRKNMISIRLGENQCKSYCSEIEHWIHV